MIQSLTSSVDYVVKDVKEISVSFQYIEKTECWNNFKIVQYTPYKVLCSSRFYIRASAFLDL